MGTGCLPEKSAASGWSVGPTGQGVVGCFSSCGKVLPDATEVWLLLRTSHLICLLMFESPQDTLAYATALLNEKEQSGSSNGSESSPANENGERHLQQVSLEPVLTERATFALKHSKDQERRDPTSEIGDKDRLAQP